MKKFWILFSFVFLLFSCTHKITRFGYVASEKTGDNNCAVQIISQEQFVLDSTYTELGKVKLGDKGFSTRCGLAEANEILKKEACALNANTVVINEAISPNIQSTCYRCRATFYRTSNPIDSNKITRINIEDVYGNNNAQKPSAGIQVVSYVAGFLVGYFLVSLLF